MTTAFTPGSTWELTIDANCIPAGRYSLVEERGEFLIFKVGKRIQFGVTTEFYRPYLKPLLSREITAPTPTYEFISKYLALMKNPPLVRTGIAGMTFCFMHPSLERQFSGIRQLLRESTVEPHVYH